MRACTSILASYKNEMDHLAFCPPCYTLRCCLAMQIHVPTALPRGSLSCLDYYVCTDLIGQLSSSNASGVLIV